ncbi:hypothetical protein SeMB42_g01696 [Synchytrium endobioticum]|uniref:Sidoreflexin n=1 Tax=Synchytrium endobioticum TaxID=286115 RepID=A0A507D2Z3_9FUNG|nr:hypothetical protein SeLEV6574_g03764 [Synchytrium endobioticum]TPX52050.1 hypothetical protein SeMB42_g01696 [Synchytrium endobioticum]
MATNNGNIDLSESRYDQGTYWGRLRHFSGVTDMRTLFATDSQLEAAKTLIADYKAGTATNVGPEELWHAKKLIDSTFHPDTGEKVLLPFRMACFVPTNVAIIMGMLVPNPPVASIIFWQWMNQSVNVAFNYFNANKTTKLETAEIAASYGSAVLASCGIAVGLSEYVKQIKNVSSATKKLISRSVPFVAVAGAGTVNVFLMRQKELRDGITVEDEAGNPVGTSSRAGWMAISQVAVSRIATAFPAVMVPGLILSRLEKYPWFTNNPRIAIPVNLATITTSLAAALPCAVALFPQRASVPVTSLEDKFRNLKRADGTAIDKLYFNRGL